MRGKARREPFRHCKVDSPAATVHFRSPPFGRFECFEVGPSELIRELGFGTLTLETAEE